MTAHARSSQPPLDPVDKTVVRDLLHKMGPHASADSVADQLAHAGISASPEQVEQVMRVEKFPGRSPATSAEQQSWQRHEHVSTTAQTPARELIERAGSPELAKQAIDAVADELPDASAANSSQAVLPSDEASSQRLTKLLGFASYQQLIEASEPLSPGRSPAWFATRDRREWVVWNDREFIVRDRFLSREAAAASIAALPES